MQRQLATLSLVATVCDLFVNATLAVAFLWPTHRGSKGYRHVLFLSSFIITVVVTFVDSFRRLLLFMGLAQCSLEQRRTWLPYITVFAIITFYRQAPFEDDAFLPLLCLTDTCPRPSAKVP